MNRQKNHWFLKNYVLDAVSVPTDVHLVQSVLSIYLKLLMSLFTVTAKMHLNSLVCQPLRMEPFLVCLVKTVSVSQPSWEYCLESLSLTLETMKRKQAGTRLSNTIKDQHCKTTSNCFKLVKSRQSTSHKWWTNFPKL